MSELTSAQRRTLVDLNHGHKKLRLAKDGRFRDESMPYMDGYYVGVVNETILADRDALVKYVRARRALSGHHLPSEAPDLVREVRDAYASLSQEMKDAISGLKTE